MTAAAGRRSARRQAVFVLYQQDLLKLAWDEAADRSREELNDYARIIVKGVDEQGALIDSLLNDHLSAWRLERVGVLERAILRVAVYELLCEKDVPVAVVIDQAVGLAKRFCSGEASSFVNGVLGGLSAAGRPGECCSNEEGECGR